MTALGKISTFRAELQMAIVALIMGKAVELSQTGKEKLKVKDGDVLYIKSLNEDETVTLAGRSQDIFERVRLTDLDFSDK